MARFRIKKLFTKKMVDAYMDMRMQQLEAVILDQLQQIGEAFVYRARSLKPKWTYKAMRKNFNRFKTKGKMSAGQQMVSRNGKTYIRTPAGGTSYADWTRNLRGSIGYAILKDGKIIQGNYSSSQLGKRNAKQTVHRIVTEVGISRGLALICVAGMEYAAAVESKDYDVISGPVTYVESDVRRMVDKIIKIVNGGRIT